MKQSSVDVTEPSVIRPMHISATVLSALGHIYLINDEDNSSVVLVQV